MLPLHHPYIRPQAPSHGAAHFTQRELLGPPLSPQLGGGYMYISRLFPSPLQLCFPLPGFLSCSFLFQFPYQPGDSPLAGNSAGTTSDIHNIAGLVLD